MQHLRLFLPVFLCTSIGCGAGLSVPATAQIRCTSDVECPADYSCREGLCKSLLTNDPPRVAFSAIPRLMGALPLPVTVSDSEGDAVDLDVEVRTTPDAEFSAVTVAGATGIPATSDGVDPGLRWETVDADLAALGVPGYGGQLVLRITPRDAFGPGAAVTSAEFAHGNDAPVLAELTMDDTRVSGNTVVRFRVSDSAADPVDIAAFEVSRLGDFSDAVLVTLTAGPGTSFPGGAIDDLRTTADGVWHNVTWNSTVDAPYSAPAARLRMQVVDSLGAVSSVVSTALSFRVDNAQTAPTLEVTPISNLAADVTAPVQLSVVPDDLDGDLSTLFVSYSTDATVDGNTRWTQAQSADDVIGLVPGTPYPFTWQIGQLPPDYYPHVWLRLQVENNLPGEIVILGPFVVDTHITGSVDTSPPNYVGPLDTVYTFATTGGDILLEWTSRLGANEYTVELSTVDDFSTLVDAPRQTAATELLVHVTEDRSYYWRVRADVTTPGQYSSLGGHFAVFHLLGDTVYVSCPSTETVCSDAGRYGNHSKPFMRINTALERAEALGLTQVVVASRGSGVGYDGIIFLKDGVELRGGYDATFRETSRDPVGNPTQLNGGHSFAYGTVGLVAEGLESTTEVSGFRIQSPDDAHPYGARVTGASDLRLTDCVVQAGLSSASSDSASMGMEIESSRVSLDNVQVASTSAWSSDGLEVTSSDLTMTGGRIEAAAGTFWHSRALVATSSTVTLVGTQVIAGASLASYAVLAEGSTLSFDTCQLRAAAGGGGAVGLEQSRGNLSMTDSTVVGNTDPAGVSTNTEGVDLYKVTGSITDSVIDSGPGTSLNAGLNVWSQELPASALTVERCSITATGGSPTGLTVHHAVDVTVRDTSILATTTTNQQSAGVFFVAPVEGPPLPPVLPSTLRLERSTIRSQSTSGVRYGLLVGDVDDSTDLVVSGCRISTSDGPVLATGVHLNRAFGSFTNNQIYAGDVTGATENLAGVQLGLPGLGAGSRTSVWTRNVIGTGDAGPSASVAAGMLNNAGNVTLTDNILFTGPSAMTDTCLHELVSPASRVLTGELVADCAAYVRIGMGMTCSSISGGNFTGGCSIIPPATGSGAATAATDVFASGFDRDNFATWVIKASGPADRDHNGVWSTGDAGVDPSMTGVSP